MWPDADLRPYLAQIVGEAVTVSGEMLVVIANDNGSAPVLPRFLTSAAPVLRALQSGMLVPYGHA